MGLFLSEHARPKLVHNTCTVGMEKDKTSDSLSEEGQTLSTPSGDGVYKGVAFTAQDAKMARRRVDMFLVSTLTLYYFMSYLDRSNLGNAKVAGIERSLGMTGYDCKMSSTSHASRPADLSRCP